MKLVTKVGTGFVAGIIAALLIALIVLMCLAPEVFFVFLLLKLLNVITFSWFYVFLPLIVFFVGIIIYTIITCIAEIR